MSYFCSPFGSPHVTQNNLFNDAPPPPKRMTQFMNKPLQKCHYYKRVCEPLKVDRQLLYFHYYAFINDISTIGRGRGPSNTDGVRCVSKMGLN